MTAIGIDIGGSSVKAAGVEGGVVRWTSTSSSYREPALADLVAAVREAVGVHASAATAIGLCVPGIMDDRKLRVTLSVNVPALNGVALADLVADALGSTPSSPPIVTNDTTATAHDLYSARRLTGRLMLLALGTGIGTAVLDERGPLCVDGESPGHFGQMDVSLDGEPIIGPDGGAGSLEGYLGGAALKRVYGDDLAAAMSRMRVGDPPMRALVRAIRIGHAIYRPHHVCLAGGVGIRLSHLAATIHAAVATHLTSVARPKWTLTTGDSDYHAAIGAAKLAR